MNDVLENPAYHALLSGDANLSIGTDKVKHFDEQVSPFIGFDQEYEKGFDDLFEILPAGRRIICGHTGTITEPKGWQMLHAIPGVQYILDSSKQNMMDDRADLVRLDKTHVPQMEHLAALTKPGPFGPRTIDFGYYHGIFDDGKLVAMTGQRFHVYEYTEVSAVCTHPDHLGKGYAAKLILHQVNLIRNQGKTPFLHVRADNARARALYERLGFHESRGMNFYFLKKRAFI